MYSLLQLGKQKIHFTFTITYVISMLFIMLSIWYFNAKIQSVKAGIQGILNTTKLLPFLKQKFGSNVEYCNSSVFEEYYIIQVKQLIDHSDSSKGYFNQTITLGHNDINQPIVMETEGYSLNKSKLNPYYRSEITQILNANQVLVEHRYFGKSIPDSTRTWLTYKQSAADYHAIKILLQDYYTGKWISTGRSKGGQEALNYKLYYPDDVDALIVYVAPVTFEKEDKRITDFLSDKRLTITGRQVFDIQEHMLKNKERLLPIFTEMLLNTGCQLSGINMEIIYDYAVLEFDFSFWQYTGSQSKLISHTLAASRKMQGGTINTSGLKSLNDWMIINMLDCKSWMFGNAYTPHFYQAYTQAGYYGYDEKPFRKYLKKTDYSLEFLAMKHPDFDNESLVKLKKFIKTDMRNTIFIYGADDPWSACGVELPLHSKNLKIINPGTNHTTSLKDLSNNDLGRVYDSLSKYLNIPMPTY